MECLKNLVLAGGRLCCLAVSPLLRASEAPGKELIKGSNHPAPTTCIFKGKINLKRGVYNKGLYVTLTVIYQYLTVHQKHSDPVLVPQGQVAHFLFSVDLLLASFTPH
jgi:hypothetical protein